VVESSSTQRIAVVTAADDNYVLPLAVTIRSALDSLGSSQGLDLYVIDGGIRPENKVRLGQSWEDPRLRLRWLAPDLSAIDRLAVSGHVTRMTYARLLLPHVLPGELDRVIYLDADLLVLRDLAALWREQVADLACRAAPDPACPWLDAARMLPNYEHCRPYLAATHPVPNFQQLGLDPTAAYFNAGVLLVNLEFWRVNSVASRALDCLQANREHVQWWDQYALNVVLHQQWAPLDVRWNQGAHIYRYPRPEACPLDEALAAALKRDPWIVHFTSPRKPWHFECDHPFQSRFLRTVDRTAWHGWRPETPYHNLVEWLEYQYDRYRQWRRRRRHQRQRQQALAKRRAA
jgi:lipopolysaccharide biosynthesis glycosyltransferase